MIEHNEMLGKLLMLIPPDLERVAGKASRAFALARLGQLELTVELDQELLRILRVAAAESSDILFTVDKICDAILESNGLDK